LVFFGENEAEYGNPIADASSAQRDHKYYAASDPSQVYFGGTSMLELRERSGLEQVDLEPYRPADPEAVERLGMEVHYLGYYLKWHPPGCYYYAGENGGLAGSAARTL